MNDPRVVGAVSVFFFFLFLLFLPLLSFLLSFFLLWLKRPIDIRKFLWQCGQRTTGGMACER